MNEETRKDKRLKNIKQILIAQVTAKEVVGMIDSWLLRNESDPAVQSVMEELFEADFSIALRPSPLCLTTLEKAKRQLGMSAKPKAMRLDRKSGWRWVAAVLIPALLVVGGYIGWQTMRSDATRDDRSVAAAFVPSQTVSSHLDEVRKITLADGTEVTLNRNSTLSYNDAREAELSGEAYFDVAENPRQPFVIHSGHLKVVVLGTEFNFHTQTEDGASKLSLYDGRVELEYSGGTQILEEGGKEFTLDPATGTADVQDFDHTQKPQWLTEGSEPEPEPELESEPEIISMSEIFDLIEAGYGVRIEGREAVDLGRRYNFMLDTASAIEQVMEVLQFVSGEFEYNINGNTIYLEKK